MRIPRYWARGSANSIDPTGKHLKFTVWGWSDEDQESARRSAERLARSAADRAAVAVLQPKVARQPYGYADRLLREEIVEEFKRDDGSRLAMITRNSYGSLILNTARVMFVDIDEDSAGSSNSWGIGRFLGRLFASGSGQEGGDRRIRKWAGDNPFSKIRLYQTPAGFRLLLAHQLYDPVSEETERLLQTFGADPLFIKLCKSQSCFRARLTPKHWRIGLERPPGRHPRETADQRADFELWLSRYEAGSASYKACRLLDQLGNGHTDPEAEMVKKVHDRYAALDPSTLIA